MGLKAFDTPYISPVSRSASFSELRIAIRFGTSSPKTRVKYDRISVMRITEIVDIVEYEIDAPSPITQSVSIPAKLSAAKALPRKPDSVIATWMVARNRAGCFISPSSFTAVLSPWAAIRASLLSLMLIIAISAVANTAFSPIRTAWSSSISHIELFTEASSLY